MAAEPAPITNYTSPIASTRQTLLNEEDGKIRGKRGFVFKSFITEKERLAEYLKLRETIYNENKLDVNRIDDKFITNYKKYTNKTDEEKKLNVQPFMRYKPRNDLERIFEAINSNGYGKITRETIENIIFEKMKQEEIKKIMNEQEKDIDFEDVAYEENICQLTDIKKHKDKLKWMKQKQLEDGNDSLNQTLGLDGIASNFGQTGYNKKDESIDSKKKNLLNKAEARLYLNEYNKKFHFKSMTKYSMFYNPEKKDFDTFNKDFISQKKSTKKFRRFVQCPFQYHDYKKETKNYKDRLSQVESQYTLDKVTPFGVRSSNTNSPINTRQSNINYVRELKDPFLKTQGNLENYSKKKTNNIQTRQFERDNKERSSSSELSDEEELQQSLAKTLKNPYLTAKNFTPQEINKVNYNPYKKRENFYVDPDKYEELRKVAYSNVNKAKIEGSKIKNARYLSKLKKKGVTVVGHDAEGGVSAREQASTNQMRSYSSLVNFISNTTNIPKDKGEKEQTDNKKGHNKLEFDVYDIDSTIKNNPLTFFQQYRNPANKRNTDEKIYIDDVEYPRTHLHDISKKVLEKCNYNQMKNKNSKNNLKIGQGKLMMTSGLSIVDFTKRYNLNP